MTQLESLIPCASFLEWRSRQRGASAEAKINAQAISALEALNAELAALNGTPLHARLQRLREAEDERAGERDRYSEIVAEELGAVGFTSFPATGRELLEKIARHLERETCCADAGPRSRH